MKNIHRYTKRAIFHKVGTAILLVAAVLGTLYVGEATFSGDARVPFASAWNCVSMTATPATITEGESSTIAWKFSNDAGVTVTIDKIAGKTWNGTSGDVSVSPTATTKYTAVAHKTGTQTTMKCNVTVTVKPAPAPLPVCTLVADKTLVEEGTSAKLTWTSQNSVSASMDNGIGTITLNGSRDVTPTATTTYKATFANKDGKKVTCEKTIAVTPKPTPAPEPVCTLTANKTSIEKGETAKLTWTSQNAVSGSMNQGIGTIALNDSRDVTPDATTTYQATFENKDGKKVTCEKTIAVTPKPTPQPSAPVCSMTISASSVNKGDSATLTWTSENVDTTSIDNGIGNVATSGSKAVTVNDATTYTGTFKGTNGTTITCTASVSIISSGGGGGGGGGPCRNCGGGGGSSTSKKSNSSGGGSVAKKVTPNVVLSSAATPAPYVYLSQVPYTGFEAGPVLTAVFWLAVLALSVLIAYVMTVPQPLSRLASFFARKHEAEMVVAATLQPVMPPAIPWNIPTSAVANEHAVQFAAASHAASGIDDIIEERAQEDHILLSPEALRAVAMEADRSSLDREAFFTAIFEEAKASFPREDGWILLSKERINAVLSAVRSVGAHATSTPVAHIEHKSEARAPYSSAMTYKEAESKTQAAPVRTYAPADARPTVGSKDVTVADFVHFFEAGEQQKAFDALRGVTAQGRGEQYVKSLVRALDDVYKNRIEGGRTPEADLARATATWSNADFEAVLGTLIESVDWSYSSARVGTKIALAKVFEYFESKKGTQA